MLLLFLLKTAVVQSVGEVSPQTMMRQQRNLCEFLKCLIVNVYALHDFVFTSVDCDVDIFAE